MDRERLAHALPDAELTSAEARLTSSERTHEAAEYCSSSDFGGTMRIVALVLCLATALQAYTDPGTGILLWQIMLAVFAGLAFKLRALVARFFGRREQSGGIAATSEDGRS